MSKFLVPILERITVNKYSIADSFSFAEELLNSDPNLVVTSFDVECFSQISLCNKLLIFLLKAYFMVGIIYILNKEKFNQLLAITMWEALVLCDREYYQQIDGVAMVSSLILKSYSALAC